MEQSGSRGAAVEGKQGTERGLVRVLLADDHKMFREGIAGVLASSYAEEGNSIKALETSLLDSECPLSKLFRWAAPFSPLHLSMK